MRLSEKQNNDNKKNKKYGKHLKANYIFSKSFKLIINWMLLFFFSYYSITLYTLRYVLQGYGGTLPTF